MRLCNDAAAASVMAPDGENRPFSSKKSIRKLVNNPRLWSKNHSYSRWRHEPSVDIGGVEGARNPERSPKSAPWFNNEFHPVFLPCSTAFAFLKISPLAETDVQSLQPWIWWKESVGIDSSFAPRVWLRVGVGRTERTPLFNVFKGLRLNEHR